MKLFKLLHKRKESIQRKQAWENAIFMAGFEYGRRIQKDIDSKDGCVTGLPSSVQVKNQIAEIIQRKGF